MVEDKKKRKLEGFEEGNGRKEREKTGIGGRKENELGSKEKKVGREKPTK